MDLLDCLEYNKTCDGCIDVCHKIVFPCHKMAVFMQDMACAAKKRPRSRIEHGHIDYKLLVFNTGIIRSSLAQSSHLLPKTNRPRLLRARAVLVRLFDHPLRDHRICHQKQIARVCESAGGFGTFVRSSLARSSHPPLWQIPRCWRPQRGCSPGRFPRPPWRSCRGCSS